VQVFAPPGSLAHTELKLREAALQGPPFAALDSGSGSLSRKFLQIRANQAGQGSTALDRDPADFFDQFVVEGKPDVHLVRIRVTHNPRHENCVLCHSDVRGEGYASINPMSGRIVPTSRKEREKWGILSDLQYSI
jgi:hypothetical protein